MRHLFQASIRLHRKMVGMEHRVDRMTMRDGLFGGSLQIVLPLSP